MPAEEWYYRLDGVARGPFSEAQFQKLVRTRTVTPDTEVSHDGQTWQTLRAAMAGTPPDQPINDDWMNAPTLTPAEFRELLKKRDTPAEDAG